MTTASDGAELTGRETVLDSIEVHAVGAADLEWPFHKEHPVIPALNNWGVDPFPAYPHDHAVVKATLAACAAAFKPQTRVLYYVSEFEDFGRTNGWSTQKWLYGDEAEESPWNAVVFLAGKRIPPHPAVTRYVVAHEYGHHVEWWLEREHDMPSGALAELYADFRCLRGHGSGGRWHDAASEVFACDFRILLAGVESDYWPHMGISHPLEDKKVQEWWRLQVGLGRLSG